MIDELKLFLRSDGVIEIPAGVTIDCVTVNTNTPEAEREQVAAVARQVESLREDLRRACYQTFEEAIDPTHK